MPRRPLAPYIRKRDFNATPEPAGRGAGLASRHGPLTFMVHRHAARRLHYDLRLELDGVLLSWAVPKGPSRDPAVRRMAIHVEDHPLGYASFEGVIPHGSYGAGESLIWDSGTYSPDEGGALLFNDRASAEAQIRAGLEAGKISATFRGRKLKGSWALVRTRDENWLLIKHRDAAADPAHDVLDDPTSVISGLTVEQMRAGAVAPAPGREPSFSPPSLEGGRAAPLEPVAPMLASSLPIPRDETGWSYEPKLDGIRLIAYLDQGHVELRSRSGHAIGAVYPEIARSLAQQPANNLVLDGEIVAINSRGHPSFELLQQRMNLSNAVDIARAVEEIPATCFVFDILYLDGYDLRNVPLHDRREILARTILPFPGFEPIATIPASADDAYNAAVTLGFEGILAKRDNGRYEPGRRSTAWLKRKALDVETFLVGGFTGGTGARKPTFGSLLVGTRDDQDRLIYRGRVGTGFDERTLQQLTARLTAATVADNPFETPVPERHKATFVRPELTVEVEHQGATNAGILRAPVFLGLHSDAGTAVSRRQEPASTFDRAELDAILEQLDSNVAQPSVDLAGEHLPLTNLDKPLWPATAGRPPVTKRNLLRYAARAWPVIQPHMRDRPVTLARFPDGIEGKRFWQRHWDGRRPKFVETVTVFSETEGGDHELLLCRNLATLLWFCQLADLEWHVSFGRIALEPDAATLPRTFDGSLARLEGSVLNYPDFLAFDLDPYLYAGHEGQGDEPQPNREAFAAACEAARHLKEILDSLGLNAFVKTSGATGLHVFVPLVRTLTYEPVRAACTTICAEMVSRYPRLVTMEWDTRKRRGKVFLDASQGSRHKSLACAYSPRAKPGGPVSLPVQWDEIEVSYPADFSFDDIVARVERTGDAWAGILDQKQDLHEILGL